MIDAPAPAAARIVSPEEEFLASLLQRHGDGVALVEMREDGQGRRGLLCVLDLDQEAISAERERVAGRLPVEFVDKVSWRAMRRLAEAGLLRFTHDAKTLHRSEALPAVGAVALPGDGEASTAMVAAERMLKMAKVLVAGGFPEEAPPLLAKSLRGIVDAMSAKHGDAGAEGVTDSNARRLVERDHLPAEALTILEAGNPASLAPSADEIESMVAQTTRILATLKKNDPSLSARRKAA
jgi:hypothetical protein